MYGLVDCNNFFVSCERLFNPSLDGKAVVVLSNNDGCVVSRSNEAKALGIPMGFPAFKIREVTNPDNVVVLSGRGAIYNDISERIMAILGQMVGDLEISSIDEAFFKVPAVMDKKVIHSLMSSIVEKIKRYVGVPVSIGVAPTRTLAKVASHKAKKDKNVHDGVYVISKLDEKVSQLLKSIPVGEIWGVGRRLEKSLHEYGIYSAYDFSKMPSSWVKSKFSISEERTLRELRGEDCTKVNAITETHKSIMVSRSFGTLIGEKKQISQAVAMFASDCAQRLRSQKSVAEIVTTYIRGDAHVATLPFYSNSCNLKLNISSSDTATIVNAALRALDYIYRDMFLYRKAGVVLSEITPDKGLQLNLFDSVNIERQRRLMKAVDGINAYCGDGTIRLGAEDGEAEWKPRKTMNNAPSPTLHIYSGMCQASKPHHIITKKKP